MGEMIKEVKGKVVVPYKWSYWETLSEFFRETKENRRIIGARCTKCGKILAPPTVVCGATSTTLSISSRKNRKPGFIRVKTRMH